MEKLPRDEAVLKLMGSEWVTWRKLGDNAMELVLANSAMLDLGEEEEEAAGVGTRDAALDPNTQTQISKP